MPMAPSQPRSSEGWAWFSLSLFDSCGYRYKLGGEQVIGLRVEHS